MAAKLLTLSVYVNTAWPRKELVMGREGNTSRRKHFLPTVDGVG